MLGPRTPAAHERASPEGPRAHWGKWHKKMPQGKGKGKGKGWGGEDWNRGWGATPSFGKGKGKGWGKGKGKGWGGDDMRAAAARPAGPRSKANPLPPPPGSSGWMSFCPRPCPVRTMICLEGMSDPVHR